MTRLSSIAPLRAVMVAVLLCVLAVRVIVPQGYMWAAAADGTAEMVICSGMGPMPRMPMPMGAASALAAQHHGESGHHDGKTADHPCAFAAASAAVDLAATLHPVAATTARAEAPAQLHIFVRPGLGLAAPPPPKTGPPSLA